MRALPPDLVITTCAWTRWTAWAAQGAAEPLAGTEVIILTAHGTLRMRCRHEMGAFRFLTKPVDKQELLDQVQKALRISGFGASDEDWRAEIVTRKRQHGGEARAAHMVREPMRRADHRRKRHRRSAGARHHKAVPGATRRSSPSTAALMAEDLLDRSCSARKGSSPAPRVLTAVYSWPPMAAR